jgi:hypothetical protein
MTSREQFFLQKMMHIVACQDIIDGQLYYQEVKKTTTSSSLKSKYLKKERRFGRASESFQIN